jgi:hypothetical protein
MGGKVSKLHPSFLVVVIVVNNFKKGKGKAYFFIFSLHPTGY